MDYWTWFAEYRRGRLPGDVIEMWRSGSATRVEGAHSDGAGRNALRLEGPNGRIAYVWAPPSADAARANCEILCLFRWNSSANSRSVLGARISGAATTETAYRLNLRMATGEYEIDKIVGGVATSLGIASSPAVKMNNWIYLKLRCNANQISARVWAEPDVEPASWLTATDSSIVDGQIGLLWSSATEIADVKYLHVVTGGAIVTPKPFTTLESILANPESELELTARFEAKDPSTGILYEFWESTHPRHNSARDYPPNVKMAGLIIPSGTVATKLSGADPIANSTEILLDSLRLNNLPLQPNSPGLLYLWSNYTLHGRPVEIRIGPLWQTPPGIVPGVRSEHRQFQIVACAVLASQPDITPSEAIFSLGPVSTLLSDRLRVNRHIGIPTGIKAITNSGFIRAPANAAYESLSWTIYMRVLIPAAGVAGSGIANFVQKRVTATRRQWYIGMYQASNGLAHTLHFISDRADGVNLISYNTATRFNLSRFVTLIFAAKSADRWYVVIDGVRVAGGTLTSSIETAVGQVTDFASSAAGVTVTDIRIEKFMPEEQAIARYVAARGADANTVSIFRCDDNVGTTVTDSAPLANHAAMQGSVTTDWIWTPTYLGSPDTAGSEMPISGGAILHALAKPIDSVRDAFRINDRAVTPGTTLTARARGGVMTPGSGYTQPSDGPGTIDIVGPTLADQPVTFQQAPTAESEHLHVLKLTKDELVARGNISSATADLESFDSVRKSLPWKGGFYYERAPTVQQFITDTVGQLCAFGLDSHGRLYVYYFAPPVNPGPYGIESLLEFTGYPNRGLLLAGDTGNTYALNASANNMSIDCWFKAPTTLTDLSTSGTFTHFPPGYTLAQCYSGSGGWHLGIDGRNGNAVFATVGLTTSGRHYTSLPFTWSLGEWTWLHGEINGTNRLLTLGFDLGFGNDITESVTGTYVPPPNGQPVSVGTGSAGSFPGSICYVVGSSPKSSFNRPIITKPTTGNRGGIQRLHLAMNTPGDHVIEAIQSRPGRIDGARWTKGIFDFRRVSSPRLEKVRAMVPASLVEARFAKNYFPLLGSNIASGVPASDKLVLGTEDMSASDPSQAIRDVHLNAREVSMHTVLYAQQDAELLAMLTRNKISFDRRAADVRDWTREVIALRPADEVIVYHPSYAGFQSGKPMRVVSSVVKIDQMTGDVSIWG